MANELELTPDVKSASQRFGWHLAGSSVGLIRDVLFMAGDFISRAGTIANRFAEVAGSVLSRKEMYKLAVNIRQRRDHTDVNADTESGPEQPLSHVEDTLFKASAFFIGLAWRKGNAIPLETNNAPYSIHGLGALSVVMTAVEWTAKIPGTLLLGIGGGIKLIARALGHARNYLYDRAKYTKEERALRAAEQTFVHNLNDVFANLDQDQRQTKTDDGFGAEIDVTKDYPSVTKLIFASFIKQIGYLVALPGRTINAVGRAVSSLNLWINGVLDIVSRFGDKTFLDYAKQLHLAMGNQRGTLANLGDGEFIAAAKSFATASLFAVTGFVGIALKYAPKVFSFLNNLLFTGIQGFALEYLGKAVAAPGNLIFAAGQKMVPDTKQRKLMLDGKIDSTTGNFEEFDLNGTQSIELQVDIDKVDYPLGLVDAEQTLSIKDTLYRTFIGNGASKARAYENGLKELRSTYHMLHSKVSGTEDASEKAAEAAVKNANGVIAQEMMGYRYGYGDSHGKHPIQGDPMLVEMKRHIKSQLDDIRKPQFTGTVKGYWYERSWIARQIIDRASSLDGQTRADLGMPEDSTTNNDGYDVKRPLLS